MTHIDRVKRFLKFCDKVVADGDWEYGDTGASMTDDAKTARVVLREWVKVQQVKNKTQEDER